jgi:hypothetical protein
VPHPGDSRVVWQDVSATSSVSALKDDVFQKKASRRQQQADLWDEVFISYLPIYLYFFFFSRLAATALSFVLSLLLDPGVIGSTKGSGPY